MLEGIEISVIPHDLRHEETIVRIADTLDSLSCAVNQIFNSINNRIEDNGKRLDKIQSRAKTLQNKLEYIQTNLNLKAVKMYSVAKYPASHTYKEYERAIKMTVEGNEQIKNIFKNSVLIEDNLNSGIVSCQSDTKQYTKVNLQEKLQFYHLRTKAENNPKDGKKKITTVSSVSALLPFDSVKSRYETTSFIASDEKEDKYKIEDAPDSILQPWHSSEVESPSGYMYAPALGEVPQINVPLILPDLPGIVDDERFTIDAQLQNPIAPSSAAVTPTLKVDLPSLITTSEQTNISSSSTNVILPDLTEKQSQQPESNPEPTPPPPPPPPPIFNISQTEPETTAPPAPPPPPPSAQLEGNKLQSETKPPVKQITDDRTNLMAAIRDAGGFGRAKLKPASASIDKNDRFASASIEGDLMADLHAKLLQRRRNMVGITSDTFKRMSNMIPPPPKPNESNDFNSATSECDSQPDVDDWDE